MPESYKEDGRPAQQWYWDDWFSAFDVRLCSLAARGLWIDMLGIMWKAKPRGALIINEKPADNKMLSRVVNATKTEVEKLLHELETENVFSRLEDGTIICRRMYYAAIGEKTLSETRADAGRKGAEKRWQKQWQTDGKNGKAMAKGNGKPMAKITEVEDSKPITGKMAKMAASSSTPSSTSNIYTPQFKKFWAEYPNKKEKDVAFEVFERLKEKEKQQTIIAARNYRIKTEREKQEKKFIKHPATFLRKNRWKDYLGPPEKEEMEAFDEMQRKALEER